MKFSKIRLGSAPIAALAISLSLSGCGLESDSLPTDASSSAEKAPEVKDAVADSRVGADQGNPSPSPAPGGGSSPSPGASPSPGPSGAPSPSPSAPSPAPSPSGTINSVDEMISDMSRMNDATLKDVNPSYGWAKGPGYVMMGNDPRWQNTPNWWKSSNPNYYTSGYWNYILPWAVTFEGTNNRASNTRIHVRNLKMYIKSKSTGAWTLVSSADRLDGNACAQSSSYFDCGVSPSIRSEPDGGASIRTPAGYNFHGWFGGRRPIQGGDIAAVQVTMQARLVVDNASAGDDRGNAEYLLHVGADYYPVDSNATTVVPAVGISRAKKLTSEWQAISMTTLSDVGIQEPGGGISAAELRAAPPPMQ